MSQLTQNDTLEVVSSNDFPASSQPTSQVYSYQAQKGQPASCQSPLQKKESQCCCLYKDFEGKVVNLERNNVELSKQLEELKDSHLGQVKMLTDQITFIMQFLLRQQNQANPTYESSQEVSYQSILKNDTYHQHRPKQTQESERSLVEQLEHFQASNINKTLKRNQQAEGYQCNSTQFGQNASKQERAKPFNHISAFMHKRSNSSNFQSPKDGTEDNTINQQVDPAQLSGVSQHLCEIQNFQTKQAQRSYSSFSKQNIEVDLSNFIKKIEALKQNKHASSPELSNSQTLNSNPSDSGERQSVPQVRSFCQKGNRYLQPQPKLGCLDSDLDSTILIRSPQNEFDFTVQHLPPQNLRVDYQQANTKAQKKYK